MKYFIVDLRDLSIVGITDNPEGVTWSVPHVFLETDDEDFNKFKVTYNNGIYYLDNIEDAEEAAEVTPWWKFW